MEQAYCPFDVVIVSRHPAAVQFIRESLPELPEDTEVLAEAFPAQVTGKIVIGNLPLHLAVLCRAVIAVEFTGAPPRGAEYTSDDMRAAGARLSLYEVTRPHYGMAGLYGVEPTGYDITCPGVIVKAQNPQRYCPDAFYVADAAGLAAAARYRLEGDSLYISSSGMPHGM